MKRHKLLIIKNRKVIDAFKLSREQIKELDRRIKEHKEGKGKSYTWEEVEARLKQLIEKKNHKSLFRKLK